jgi:hypothetical protein
VDDRTVLALLLLLIVGFIVWCAFCAALLALTRAVSATARVTGRLVHEVWEWAAAWVLVVATQAGPMDADPDSYAARVDALPIYTDRTTTPGGPR